MNILSLIAAAPNIKLILAPDSHAGISLWVVAVPCVIFALYLLVDPVVVRIKKRRLHKMQVCTNEVSASKRFAADAGSSADEPAHIRGLQSGAEHNFKPTSQVSHSRAASRI